MIAITEKIELSSNSQYPPKKRNLDENKRYETKNSDTNILRMKSKENYTRNNDDLKEKKKK